MLSVVRDWQKRERIRKIVGLVFYEKRQEASILDCYLKVCQRESKEAFFFRVGRSPECQEQLKRRALFASMYTNAAQIAEPGKERRYS